MRLALTGNLSLRRASGFSPLASLVSFISANYNQPNPHNQDAMSSPPTVTATGGTRPASTTVEHLYRYANANIAYYGGGELVYGSVYRRFPEVTQFSSGGNVGSGKSAFSARAESVFNTAKVGVCVLGGTEPVRFIVDGQYVSLAGHTTSGTTGGQWFELDFGTKTTRTVAVELGEGGSFYGFAIPSGDSIAHPSPPEVIRMIVMGDSFTAGTASTLNPDGFVDVCADMLGIQDAWSCGVGGGGYVNTNSGTVYKLSEHLFDANDNGPWDIIVVALGVNDGSHTAEAIETQARSDIQSLRSSHPTAPIFVVGGWDGNAPSAPSANFVKVRDAIEAGVQGISGVTFLDPTGVEFTKGDAVHPDTAGHKVLGEWLALQIKNALTA